MTTLENTTPVEDQLIRLIRSEPHTENEDSLFSILERLDTKLSSALERVDDLEAELDARK